MKTVLFCSGALGLALSLLLVAGPAAGEESAAAPGAPAGKPEAAPAAEAAAAPLSIEELSARIAALEAELAAMRSAAAVDPEADGAEAACAEPEEESEAVKVQMYGDFQLQGQLLDARGVEEGGRISDIDLYYGEVGWDAACGDKWAGHFSLNVDDDDDSVTLYEAWGSYHHPRSGAFVQLGQIGLPFGDNRSYFPTYAATNDLGITTAKGLGVGVDKPGWRIAGYLVNPDVEVYGNMLPEDPETGRRKLDEYCLWWDVSRREADECHDGHQLSVGYISHLSNHDFGVVEGPVSGRVPGLNVFSSYDWDENRWHASAEYVGATKSFDPADLDANEDGKGDRPAAWNFELARNTAAADTWALGYQHSAEFVDHPSSRYALMYGHRLCDIAELRLELSHGRYGSFVSDGRSADTNFIAEFHLSF